MSTAHSLETAQQHIATHRKMPRSALGVLKAIITVNKGGNNYGRNENYY